MSLDPFPSPFDFLRVFEHFAGAASRPPVGHFTPLTFWHLTFWPLEPLEPFDPFDHVHPLTILTPLTFWPHWPLEPLEPFEPFDLLTPLTMFTPLNFLTSLTPWGRLRLGSELGVEVVMGSSLRLGLEFEVSGIFTAQVFVTVVNDFSWHRKPAAFLIAKNRIDMNSFQQFQGGPFWIMLVSSGAVGWVGTVWGAGLRITVRQGSVC